MPKSHDLGSAVFDDPNVARLDVAVDDALLVGMRETEGDLMQQVELGGQGYGVAALDLDVEVLAGQVLLDQVGHLVFETEVEDRHDVAVLSPAGDLGFLEEAAAELGILRGAGLDRHVALDQRVEALVHLAETTRADLFGDLILAHPVHW